MTNSASSANAAALRAAAHQLLQIADEMEATSSPSHNHLPGSDMAPMQMMAELASRWHAYRERRTEYFNRSLFSEPAWDMLLYLFMRHGEARRVRKTELTNASGCPTSTALRHMDVLLQEGYLVIEPCTRDHRVSFVSLTLEGKVRMASYLTRVLRLQHRVLRQDLLNQIDERRVSTPTGQPAAS